MPTSAEREDYHPSAVSSYEARFGEDFILLDLDKNLELSKKWTRYKTEVLIDFTKNLYGGG